MKKICFLFLVFSLRTFSQLTVPPVSSITCDSNTSSATFSVNSGTAPYSYTVQTPACASSYTAGSSGTNITFTFNCPGIYTVMAKDAYNNPVGTVNHTVIFNTFILLDVVMESDENDSICIGETVLLYGHLINPIAWSNGESMSSINVSPTITTTYSFSGIYDAAGSRTCTANGYKTIVVLPCNVGTDKIPEIEKFIKLFPNPVSRELNIEINDRLNQINGLIIVNVLGQTVYNAGNLAQKEKIEIEYLPVGIYFLKIQTGSGQRSYKIIKE